MASTKKVLTYIAAFFGVAILSWVVLIGAVYATDWVLDEEELLELHAEMDLGEWAPMIHGLLEELDDCPDVTLVEVEDDEVWVRVRKKRGKLVVEVEEPSTSVKVSIPTRSIHRTVSRLTS
jgi:hypothetical protein